MAVAARRASLNPTDHGSRVFPSAAMRFRAFPVAVVIDGALHEPALVWATDDRTEVWVSGATRGEPRLVATLAPVTDRARAKGRFLETPKGARKVRYVAELGDGTELEIGQAPGCGCGHPLKSWSPPVEASA